MATGTPTAQALLQGQDGVAEIKHFPNDHWDGTGLPPGNFGDLQIGPRSDTYHLELRERTRDGRQAERPTEMDCRPASFQGQGSGEGSLDTIAFILNVNRASLRSFVV
jgi:hypothetical protein